MTLPPDLLNWDVSATGLAVSRQIYLDNNATTPLAQPVAEAMAACWQAGLGNPSSQHRTGQATARTLELARETLLELLDAEQLKFPADQLIFTSGGTEANNLALFGLLPSRTGNLVISTLEHPSVMQAARRLQKEGMELRLVAPNLNGRVDPRQVADAIDSATRLVSIMLASNETGVIQPVGQIAAICRERQVLCHTDAVQAVGKIDVSFSHLGVDALTFAPHKFHGPLGIGGLMLRAGTQLEPMLQGGFQQQGLRSGTENVVLAVGAAAALSWYLREKLAFRQLLSEMRNGFEDQIRSAVPAAVILGERVERLPQTSQLAFPGVDRQRFVLAADMAGIACSAGSACASGSSEPSPALLSMGLDPELVEGAIRFSFGVLNLPAEALESAKRISLIYDHLRRQISA